MTEDQKDRIVRSARLCESARGWAAREMTKPDGDPEEVHFWVDFARMHASMAFEVAKS